MHPKVHRHVCLQKLEISILLYSNHLPSYFFRKQVTEILLSPPPQCWNYRHALLCLAFHMDPKDLNSAPHGNMESNFPTKSFPLI